MKIPKIAQYLSAVTVSILIFVTAIYAQQTIAKRVPEPESWVGKKVIFLPKYESLQKYGYLHYSYTKGGGRHPSYKEFVGKAAQIIEVKKRKNPWSTHDLKLKPDESEKIIYTRAYGSNLKDVGFLSEIEGARDFIGKTVWNKRNPTVKDKDERGSIRCQRRIKNLEEVTVKDIEWGYNSSSPLRFAFETKDGIKGYWDGSYSRINDTLNHLLLPFDENWYFEDPHKPHPNWSQWTRKAIENEKIYVGMAKEMVLISWGEPDDIRHSVEGKKTQDQWTYVNTYLYFKNGKLVRIQDYEED